MLNVQADYNTGTSKINVNSLTDADVRMLERSFIPPELAIEAGIERVDSIQGAELAGRFVGSCTIKGHQGRPAARKPHDLGPPPVAGDRRCLDHIGPAVDRFLKAHESGGGSYLCHGRATIVADRRDTRKRSAV